MSTLYFVRHGESTANAGGVTMPHAKIPLSSWGLEQAQLLSSLLNIKPARVLTSSYLRARQTASPLCAKADVAPQVHPLLHEFSALDSDLIAGMLGAQRRPIADAYWQVSDPAARHGPQAETFAEFNDRVAGFIAELPALPDQTVLFGHGIWFGLLCWLLLGFEAEDSTGMREFRTFQRAMEMPNCAVYSLDSSESGEWTWQSLDIFGKHSANKD